jgi:hypothetical protein
MEQNKEHHLFRDRKLVVAGAAGAVIILAVGSTHFAHEYFTRKGRHIPQMEYKESIELFRDKSRGSLIDAHASMLVLATSQGGISRQSLFDAFEDIYGDSYDRMMRLAIADLDAYGLVHGFKHKGSKEYQYMPTPNAYRALEPASLQETPELQVLHDAAERLGIPPEALIFTRNTNPTDNS